MRRFVSLKQHVSNTNNRTDIFITSLAKSIGVYYNVVRVCIKDAHFFYFNRRAACIVNILRIFMI